MNKWSNRIDYQPHVIKNSRVWDNVFCKVFFSTICTCKLNKIYKRIPCMIFTNVTNKNKTSTSVFNWTQIYPLHTFEIRYLLPVFLRDCNVAYLWCSWPCTGQAVIVPVWTYTVCSIQLLSSLIPVSYGVPQGSVLRPVLFLLNVVDAM